MKFNTTFLSSLLIASISQLTMDVDAWAAKEENTERWFEVEVILFKQLNDKKALKENFPDDINTVALPNYKKSFDLFSPYLQPNLTNIKQFAALCGEKDAQHQYLDSLLSVTTPFPEQMQLIEQVAPFEMPDFNQEEKILEESVQTTHQAFSEQIKSNNETQSVLAEHNQSNDAQPLLIPHNEASENTEVPENKEINSFTFEFDLQQEALDKPIFSTQSLCVISQHEMDSLFSDEKVTDLMLDSFDIDHLPTQLNASGAHVQNSPYLIADESLLLKDISQRLRWSKEFKPLLHFGWRQVGVTQSKAIPLKLFAGEHLAHAYQKALTTYQDEIDEAKEIEQNLLAQLAQNQDANQPFQQENNSTELINNESVDIIADELDIKVEKKQHILNTLFANVNYVGNNPITEDTINETIKTVSQQTFETLFPSTSIEPDATEQVLDHSTPPIKPLQPWYLDGFFKVHLDHYLYITADFNVFNQNKITIQTEDSNIKDLKLINFNQNRRVITGEIHYFDHPYIGMIVQIRRFDPTKPADEAVTQAIK